MQAVFALSAAAMFVPVIFHTTRVKETDSLNRDAPGMLPNTSFAHLASASLS